MATNILRLHPLKQWRPAYCGPAALRILIDFFGIKKSEAELARFCKTTKKHGTHPWDLVSAAGELGLNVRVNEMGDWELLNSFINKDKLPVLVDWWKVDDGHYSVICGLDKKFVWIADPAEGKIIKMDWVKFRRVWFDFEGDVLEKKSDLTLRWWLVAKK